ncbi:hypothetical protein SAMN05421638_0841 [Kaistella treverensis]|uniref:Glycosyl transferase family 1 domain-containing protein n=1 Tax=Kaistella treverensis TaxID=631455 RepID=A0A1I3KJF5_9FLAO|nr:hypothetical protein [Kaistella treverensis]SFI72544.1 hypothetical protein SAMN05421638_0841 [Kaistella treverensis]
MKKIAYIELDTHAEIAGNFLELMKNSSQFSVDFYFSEKIFKQIGKNDPHIFVVKNGGLLQRLKEKKYDLVIIGTVHRYFNLFNEISAKFNTAIIVHNVNFSRISKFQLIQNIFKKDFKYRLKLAFKEDLLFAPQVFKNAEKLLVLDQNLKSKNMVFLPVFFTEKYAKKETNIFTIVVPGAVSQARRDYKKILSALSKFSKNNPQRKLKIVFLGKAQDEELLWLQSFEKTKSKNISIQYFTEKVPQHIFDEWMQKADVLWCPIQRETEFFSNHEIYGETKMSGNIGDAIKFGKVAFFPENFSSAYEFIKNEDSLEKILAFKTANFFDFQREFNREKVAAELEKVLHSLI